MVGIFRKDLESAKNISDIFKIVKSAAWRTLHQSRSGLELGVVRLDTKSEKVLGAFHPTDSNIIILNEIPLTELSYLDPTTYKSYVFHVLLYEYLRSMGYHDPKKRKELSIIISERKFGREHMVTKIAQDITEHFPNIVYMLDHYPKPETKPRIVKDFDQIATNYIG